MKFYESEKLAVEDGIFPAGGFGITPGEENEDEFTLEKAVVQRVHCNPQSPICLYDFTVKHVMSDYLVFAVPNLLDVMIDNFYYGPDNKDKLKKLSEDLTPQHFEEEFKASSKRNIIQEK